MKLDVMIVGAAMAARKRRSWSVRRNSGSIVIIGDQLKLPCERALESSFLSIWIADVHTGRLYDSMLALLL